MKKFTNFDLPVKHLEGVGEHYIPPKARYPKEIERRKQLAKGVLLAEMQAKGIRVAKNILNIMKDEEDILFATRTLGASTLNTAWYSYANGAKDVMRRTLSLPNYEKMDTTIAKPLLMDIAAQQMSYAEKAADEMVEDGHNKRTIYLKHKKLIGTRLGSTAILLANVPHAEVIGFYREPAFQQMVARQSALELLEDSRNLHAEVGTNPTLAQLADVDSPLSVYWRRNAPDVAYEALEAAIEV